MNNKNVIKGKKDFFTISQPTFFETLAIQPSSNNVARLCPAANPVYRALHVCHCKNIHNIIS